MKIKPLKKYLLIEKLKVEKTNSGIILPDSETKNETQVGTIIVVGPECTLKEGMKIIYPEYTISKFNRDNIVYLLIKEQDVLATIEE